MTVVMKNRKNNLFPFPKPLSIGPAPMFRRLFGATTTRFVRDSNR